MTEFMQNIYVYLWGVLALLALVIGIKQKAAYAFVVCVFFIYMTVWYALNTFAGYDMFNGTAGIIFKAVLVAFLAAFVGFYVLSKRKSGGGKS